MKREEVIKENGDRLSDKRSQGARHYNIFLNGVSIRMLGIFNFRRYIRLSKSEIYIFTFTYIF